MRRVVRPTSRGLPLSSMTMAVMVASQDTTAARRVLTAPSQGIHAGPRLMNDRGRWSVWPVSS